MCVQQVSKPSEKSSSCAMGHLGGHLPFYRSMGSFASHLWQVYEASWYMLHYGASSPKRHVMFSNSPHISKLWVSRLVGWKKSNNAGAKPCRTYHDRSGKKRFVGTRFLKGTETLGTHYLVFGSPCSRFSK